MKTLRVRCPAKVNLHLRVLGRRSDGYHELITLIQPVELFDEIVLTIGGAGIRLQCDHPQLQTGEDNLAWKAATLYQEETGDHFGLEIRLFKRIPLAAGLGGGSSDAAGVLVALNELRGGDVSPESQAHWARRLGADVAFFLRPGPSVATGIGEKLRPVRILPSLNYVIVFPGWPISTKWVYENLDLGLTNTEKDFNIPNLIERIETIVGLLHNDLELVTTRAHPWISQTKARLLECGALGALMSGSGPTVFGIFADEVTAQGAWQRLLPHVGEAIWCVRGVH